MSIFPLFDELSSKVAARGEMAITESYLKRLNDTLSACDIPQSEQVTLLIITFYSKMNPGVFTPDSFTARGKMSKLPYGIKCTAGMKGFSFSIDGMPKELQFLLGEYCELN